MINSENSRTLPSFENSLLITFLRSIARLLGSSFGSSLNMSFTEFDASAALSFPISKSNADASAVFRNKVDSGRSKSRDYARKIVADRLVRSALKIGNGLT